MDRRDELEEILECSIIEPVTSGTSLEKYHAKIENQEVMLRIYNDSYYTDRFLREGMVLRQVEPTATVHTPAIIDEWPEYQIRAIEWLNLSEDPINSSQTMKIIQWLENQEVSLPYDLKSDLISHLTDTSGIHIAYQDFMDEQVEIIFEHLNWGNDKSLVHGDFHALNLGQRSQSLVIYDWEYATIGSSNYDLAYISLLNPELLEHQPNVEWQSLAAVVLAHWYLQSNHFSPKDALKWVNKLDELTDQL